ncbi:uncharacterized protein [Anoplolepis gracilipes]|uniref:uncharacterized protein n=1 Tax=Anoplolepis gracilipes TaxID=354296 RepID=UPI003B9F9F12
MLDLVKKEYKKPPTTFGKAREIKNNLIRHQQKERKKRKTEDLEQIRKTKELSKSSTISQKDVTKRKLLQWKLEREKKKKQQEPQKKPPFIVGIVRHHFYSPITSNSITITKKKTNVQTKKKSSNQKEITRAMELSKKANVEKQKAAISNTKKFSVSDNYIKSDKNKRKSFAPLNHKFHPPAGLPKISLYGEECLEDELANKKNIPACDNLTENVTTVLSSNEFPIKDAITEKLDMSVEEKEYIVEYFKHLLYKEKDRLQKCCEYWTKIQLQKDIKEDIRCRINQAVGQTTLLINEKFKQFNGLILLCEEGNTDILITCTDLHGFWDLTYIEIKDCNSRFEKLEELRARNWREEQSSFTNSAKKETSVKKQTASMKQNSLQVLILSDDKKEKMAKMRDNKKDPQQISIQSVSEISIINKFITPPISDKTVKTVDKGRDVTRRKCCKSLLKIYAKPLYTSTPLNNNDKSNNLNMNGPLITMKIGQLYNKSTMQIDDYTCISPGQTPKKSIMETSGTLRRSSRIKLAHNANNNFILQKQTNLEINQNSQILLKKIDSSEVEKLKIREINEGSRVKKKDCKTNGFATSFNSTVIEKTIKDKDETLKFTAYNTLYNSYLIKTPVSTRIKNKSSL